MDYVKLKGIIEGYVTGSSISGIESDYLLTINSLSSAVTIFFLHVCRFGNNPVDFLTKSTLLYDVSREWNRSIPNKVAHIIIFYFNNI